LLLEVTLPPVYADLVVRRRSDSSYVIGIEGTTIFARRGTGQIDFSGTVATRVIQSAIDALGSAGGTIFLTAGRYEVTQIVLTKPGVTIDADTGAVLFAVDNGIAPREFYSKVAYNGKQESETAVLAPVVLVDSAHDIIIRNIVIDGNPMSRTVARDGILVWDSSRVLIERCEIKNVEGNPIRVRSSGTYNVDYPDSSHLNTSDITIRDCNVHDTITHPANWILAFGYEIEFSDHVTISSSVASNCQESLFRLHYSRHVILDGNTADLIDRGGEPHSGEAFDIYRSDQISIRNNRILEPAGIYVYEYVRNLVAEGNQLTGCRGDCGGSRAVSLQGISDSRSLPIENIQFKNNVVAGCIYLGNYYMKNFTFVGNTFYALETELPSGVPTTIEGISFVTNTLLTSGENPPAAIVMMPMSFVGNTFHNRIYVLGVSGNVVVQKNDFSSDGVSYASGIYIKDSVQHIQIEGNYFHELTFEGIIATGSNGAVDISSNTFDHNGYNLDHDQTSDSRNQINLYPGSASSVILHGNTFRNTVGPYAAWLGGNPSDISGNISDKPIG
jgi:hypothetical protein